MKPPFSTYSPDWTAMQIIDEQRRAGLSMRGAMAYAKAHHALRVGVADLLCALCFHVEDLRDYSSGYSEWFVEEGIEAAEAWREEREHLQRRGGAVMDFTIWGGQ